LLILAVVLHHRGELQESAAMFRLGKGIAEKQLADAAVVNWQQRLLLELVLKRTEQQLRLSAAR